MNFVDEDDQPPSYDEVIWAEELYPPLVHLKSTTSTNSLPSYGDAINSVENESHNTSNNWIQEVDTEEPQPSTSTSPIRRTLNETGSATVLPYPDFNVEQDTDAVRTAIETRDKHALIEILCNRSESQRFAIANLYQQLFDTTLSANIKDYINSYNFTVLMRGLCMPFSEFMARAIHNSYSYKWICGLMFVLSNDVREDLRNYFNAKYHNRLSTFITTKVCAAKNHPDNKIFPQILRVCETDRDTNTIIIRQSVIEDTAMLLSSYTNLENREIITSMFYSKNFDHIKLVCAVFERQTEEPINHFIERAFPDHAYVFHKILEYIRNPARYFAHVLKKSMKGLGTNEILLSSVVLLRCGVDMVDIKREFQVENESSLRSWIRGDTSSYYKYALYKLIGEERTNRG